MTSSSGVPGGTQPSQSQPTVGRELACGHTIPQQTGPVVIFPTRRRLYECPEGCGLVEGAA